MEPNDAAKRVLIGYRQLSEILKTQLGIMSAQTRLESYNRILSSLQECFALDPAFADAVHHLHPLRESEDLRWRMESEGQVLLATAHSFIELYLSPEDKKKTIGFHSE